MTELESAILKELQSRRGPANAITASVLAKLVGTDERHVREIIHDLRVEQGYGEIIGGTGSGDGVGYWWAETVEQLERARHKLASRIDKMGQVMGAYWQARERMTKPPAEQANLFSGN